MAQVTVPPPPATAIPLPAKKRPIDEVDSEEDDDDIDFKFNCNQVRNKINAYLRSGEMKVTEFLNHLDINSNSYQRFMKLKGPAGGMDNQTYQKAGVFFYKREKQGIKIKRKKVEKPEKPVATAGSSSSSSSSTTTTTSTTASTTTTTTTSSGDEVAAAVVELPLEKEEKVPIYDTCDEIRRKINAHLRDTGSTQAAFLRAIGGSFYPPVGFQNKQLTEFLQKKGPTEGAASRVYYGAYVYFEKQRVQSNKPKSKTREEMEEKWGPDGVPRQSRSAGVICHVSQVPVIDKYGKVTVVPKY